MFYCIMSATVALFVFHYLAVLCYAVFRIYIRTCIFYCSQSLFSRVGKAGMQKPKGNVKTRCPCMYRNNLCVKTIVLHAEGSLNLNTKPLQTTRNSERSRTTRLEVLMFGQPTLPFGWAVRSHHFFGYSTYQAVQPRRQSWPPSMRPYPHETNWITPPHKSSTIFNPLVN